jgi:hypothetical protein
MCCGGDTGRSEFVFWQNAGIVFVGGNDDLFSTALILTSLVHVPFVHGDGCRGVAVQACSS